MMAERRVVRVLDIERLTPTGRKVVLDAAENVPDDLVLIFTGTVPRGSRAAFYRDLAKRCLTVEWSSPRASELPGWILQRGGERWGIELTHGAARALAAAIG